MRIPSITVLSIFLLWTLPLYAADSSAFQKAANSVIASIKSGDFKRFRNTCSKSGIEIVRRGVDWKSTRTSQNGEYKSPTYTNDPLGFERDSLEVSVWVDEEVHFDRDELDQKSSHKVIERFRAEIKETYGGINASTNLSDAWDRKLGPAAGGKLASNCFWYIYFTQEDGRWKVWKLEFVTH